MENVFSIRPTGKFPEEVELLRTFSRLERPNGNLCSIYRNFSSLSPVPCLSRSFKRPGFPWLPRVAADRVRFLKAFCKQTSGLLRVLCCHVLACSKLSLPVHVSRVKCCMKNSEKFFRSQAKFLPL